MTELNSVEPDRELVTIVAVKNLLPIAEADLIELAIIEGWQCIVKKNEFKIGDIAIYFAIDSIPDLNDKNTQFIKDKGGRIKTIKMRGIYSQGLLAPLSWLSDRGHDITKYKIGDNVTLEMGVTKYVSTDEISQYAQLSQGTMLFPNYVPKTDEHRLQGNLKDLEKIKGRQIVITRKDDGCSSTFVFNNREFKVCGRNFEFTMESQSAPLYYAIEKKFNIKEKMMALNLNIAIQGELVGPKVNGNRLKLKDYDFRVFNIYDIDTKSYKLHNEVLAICDKLKLNTVPRIYHGLADNLDLSVKGMLDIVIQQEYDKNIKAEGIVVKTDDTLGERISFKVISPEYLAKHAL